VQKFPPAPGEHTIEWILNLRLRGKSSSEHRIRLN
jgi:hypothetical protein